MVVVRWDESRRRVIVLLLVVVVRWDESRRRVIVVVAVFAGMAVVVVVEVVGVESSECRRRLRRLGF